MLAEDRRQAIIHRVNQSGGAALQVSELAEEFAVTGMTIRRDLEYLEARGLVRRVHGGVVSRIDGLTWTPFLERRKESSRQKAQIGLLAASLIPDAGQVILDSGTTTLQIARHLSGRPNLTVVTNSLSIAAVLARVFHGRAVQLGGDLRLDELCVVGPVAVRQLEQYSVDAAFISAAGFSLAKGATDTLLAEIEVKQAMLRSARRAILVVDSTKWQLERFSRFAELSMFHTIISDDGLPPDAIEQLQSTGVQVMTPLTGS
jgi:DeoR/GlpR family transcriptional regulator of sugar metabolism